MAEQRKGPGRPPGRLTPETKGLSTRMEPRLIKELKRIARADGRSVSNYLGRLVEAHIAEVNAKE